MPTDSGANSLASPQSCHQSGLISYQCGARWRPQIDAASISLAEVRLRLSLTVFAIMVNDVFRRTCFERDVFLLFSYKGGFQNGFF